MTEAISITFPAIPSTTIEQITETEQILLTASTEFVRALREKYAPLAKLNGYIKISHYSIGNQNWSQDGDTWLVQDNVRVKGLLAGDYFGRVDESEFAGRSTGQKLYLTANGWVEITRSGHWSNWQGAPSYWTCDGEFADEQSFEGCDGGSIRWLSDEQVAAEFRVDDVAKTLAESLTTLAAKIPERMTRKRTLAESFKAITAQLA